MVRNPQRLQLKEFPMASTTGSSQELCWAAVVEFVVTERTDELRASAALRLHQAASDFRYFEQFPAEYLGRVVT